VDFDLNLLFPADMETRGARMSAVSSSAGVANLLQILSNSGSPVLSSPALVSDLQDASPADIIQISVAAIQLQGMDTLLGISSGDASDSSTSSLSNIFEDMAAAQTSPTALPAPASDSAGDTQSSSTTSSTESTADQLAAAQAVSQSTELQNLFGTESSASSNPLFDITG
jgi:hypothetical protein